MVEEMEDKIKWKVISEKINKMNIEHNITHQRSAKQCR